MQTVAPRRCYPTTEWGTKARKAESKNLRSTANRSAIAEALADLAEGF